MRSKRSNGRSSSFSQATSLILASRGSHAAYAMMYSYMAERPESDLLEAVQRCCEAARDLSLPEPPSTLAPALDGGSDSVTDWPRLLEMLGRAPGLRERMLDLQMKLY